MDLLLGVSTHGSWDLWIQFCLEGVISQAADAEKRCDKLLAVHHDFKQRLNNLPAGSVRLARLVDRLFESPVISVRMYKKQFGVTYPTARSHLKKLHALGIIEPLEEMQFITYYCPTLYRITYGDMDED